MVDDGRASLGLAGAVSGALRARIEAAFEREQLRIQRAGLRVTVVAFPLIVAWVTVENGLPAAFAFYPLFAALAALLAAPYLLRRAGWFRPWQEVALAALYPVLVLALAFTRPASDAPIPLPLFLTFGNEAYLFVIVAAAVFSFSPRVILTTGVAAAAAYSLTTAWILSLPETVGDIPEAVWQAMSPDERVRAISNPQRIHIGRWVRQVVTLLIVAGTLSAFVRLMRGLVLRQAALERERANLSRYFSQNMVEELAQTDEPLGPTRRQEVAVLFADLVGFTAWSEERAPEQVIELVRDFHARMERAVFAHGGTIDKYIGDAVMATFGTPRTSGRDAGASLRCARAMVESVDDWNAERERRGLPVVRCGVGVHYGAVVLGDVGGDQRLEFTVLGDTVNVASRLEHLTRALGARAVVSEAVVAAARHEGADLDGLLRGFRDLGVQTVRGRAEGIRVWALAEESAG